MNEDINFILKYRPQVKAALETYLRGLRQSSNKNLVWNRDVTERLLTFATTGKLLRGCLVCYGYALDGEAEPAPAVLNTAIALELMHSALVIHDDVIDRDDTRRGQPAVHIQYKQLGSQQQLTDPQRFGEAMALCAGDMALFLALGVLRSAPAEAAAETAITGLFSRALADVCAGQMEDVYLGMSAGQPGKRAIYSVMRSKTATYSVALPLAAGAILAGQPAAKRQGLYELGLAAGIIFQIRDDELGALGQTHKLGKPVGSDIREGKKTLLHHYLWQAASTNEKRYFKTVFGNPGASQADIIAVQAALQRYDIPLRLKQDIDNLERTARRHIERLGITHAAQDKLRRMVAFCATRQV